VAVLTPQRVLAEDNGPAFAPVSFSTADTTLRWLLAACSLGAAAVHFAYSPAHFAEYWLYGLFFVAGAWLQVLWAFAVVMRSRRWLMFGGAALNAAIVAVWIASRTVGVWVGPNATVKEKAAFPDLLCTALEALIVAGSLLILARPRWLGRRFRVRWATPVAVTGAVAFIAGAGGYALTPRFAAAHVHGSAAAVVVHTHGPTGSASKTAGITGSTPCEKAGPPASQGQVFDSAGHFHRGPTAQVPIDQATRVQLQTQQEQARAVAAKYPTVADAEQAGYRQSTVYIPCIGAHYTNTGLAGAFNPSAPSELLYDGIAPTARIVGLSYLVYHPGGPPEGFAGPNDIWHQHTFNGGLCISTGGIVIGAEATTPAQCAALGGRKIPLTDIWMLHDWVVPGFECSWGVFASECPELGGRVGGTAFDAPDPRQLPVPQG
jgi:hypothetical protein